MTSTYKGSRLSHEEVMSIFESRQQQTNMADPWLCPRCHEAKQTYLNRIKERAEQEKEAQQREWARQQAIFGPNLKRPFHRHEVAEMERKASTLRFALRYMPYPQRLIAHFRENPRETLIARRCAKCGKPMMCVDGSEFLADFRVYYPMLEYFQPNPGTRQRGFFISKCLHCDTRQKLSTMWAGNYVTIQGRELTRWVDAFSDEEKGIVDRNP